MLLTPVVFDDLQDDMVLVHVVEVFASVIFLGLGLELVLVTTIFFAFDEGVDEGVGGYVRKLNNVAPELLPVVGAVLGDVTIVHDIVGLVDGHALGNAGSFEGLHGHDVGVIVS